MRPRFEAVVFDVDHTLINPTRFIEGAVTFALNALGLSGFNKERWEITNGKSLKSRYRDMLEDQNLSDSQLVTLTRYHKAFQIENTNLVSPYEDSLLTLESLRESGIKTAAVSNRPKITLIPTLEYVGLSPLLDVVIAGDEVENPKPHPEPILKALEFLGVAPHKALMIGDTKEDMEAAIAAKVTPILIQREGFFKQDSGFGRIRSLYAVLSVSRLKYD